MLRDSSPYERQIIDAVKSVNRALGGRQVSSSAKYKSDFNQFEVQLIDAIRSIGQTIKGGNLSILSGGDGEGTSSANHYIGTTKAQTAPAPQALTGITTIDASGLATVGSLKLGSGTPTLLWDSSASAWHLTGNFYADGWIAAGGVGSGGGGGGSTVVVTQILTSGTAIASISVDGVSTTLYAPSGGGGTTVSWGTASGYSIPLTVSGTTKNLVLSDALTAYATKNWVNTQGFLTSEIDPTVPSWAKEPVKPDYNFSEINNKPTTLSGYGITDAKIQNNILTLGSTSVDLSNFVTLNGAQTITGTKTFTGTICGFMGDEMGWSIDNDGSSEFDNVTARYGSFSELYVGGVKVEMFFEKVNIGTSSSPSYAIRVRDNLPLYSNSWIAAGGVGSGGGGGGATSLSDLVDVNLSSLTGGDVLTYNSTSRKWVNTKKSTYLSDYADKAWVQSRGYLTSSALASYATRDWVQSWVQEQGYITSSSLSNYVTLNTQQEITGAKTFKTSAVSLAGVILSFKDGGATTTYASLRAGDTYLQVNVGANKYMFYPSNGLFFNGGGVPCGRSDHRWSNVYSVLGDFSGNLSVGGTVSVNSVNSIDQSNSGMALFNYGGRATKTFNAYGTSFNLRVHDPSSPDTMLNILAVNATKIQAGSDIIPNYTTGINLGGNAQDQRWSKIYGVDMDLDGNLSMRANKHIDLGPVRIEFNATQKALHITTNDATNYPNISLYADGWIAAGGVQASS